MADEQGQLKAILPFLQVSVQNYASCVSWRRCMLAPR